MVPEGLWVRGMRISEWGKRLPQILAFLGPIEGLGQPQAAVGDISRELVDGPDLKVLRAGASLPP